MYLDQFAHLPFFRRNAAPKLENNTLHLWEIEVPEEADRDRALLGLLTDAEVRRAERILIGGARREFVMGRACLRALIGGALQKAPQTVEIVPGKNGKPKTEGLHFNLSHSQGVLLIGLALDAEIGVDVEWVGSEVEVLEIAEAICSPSELALLLQLPEGELQTQAFYRCWTRKEALLKALGTGMDDSIKKYSVNFEAMKECPAYLAGKTVGFTHPLQLRDGYHGAVATLIAGQALCIENQHDSCMND